MGRMMVERDGPMQSHRRLGPAPAHVSCRSMSGSEGRLKTCVQCGAILQAADVACTACGASQPAPGAPRPPRSPPAATGERAPSLLRSLLLPLVIVLLLVALALGLQAVRSRLAARSAAGARPADAARVTPVGSEAPDSPDALDRFLAGGATAVEVDLQREQQTYSVEGAGAQQIFLSIDERGPDGPDGKAVGLTRLESGEYQYVRDPDSGRCAVTRIAARLTILLPKLTSRSVSLEVESQWKDYLRAVRLHEERHAEIYSEAVHRVAERLRSAEPFADPSAMQAGFQDAWTREMEVAERENLDFHRREERSIAKEIEAVTAGLARVDGELAALERRIQDRLGRHPDGRLPPDEYERHTADTARYDELRSERVSLVERGLWLH
jgi:predicted secreted Zn-dependent protease